MNENTIQDARSTVQMDSLQELFDAEPTLSPRQVLISAQNQFQTPNFFIEEVLNWAGEFFPWGAAENVFDPQAAGGNLLLRHRKQPDSTSHAFGCDIDNRLLNIDIKYRHIKSNSMKLMEIIDDVFPDTCFHMFNANPPFSKKWSDKDGKVWDSTEWTWKQAIKRGAYGIFICKAETAWKLKIDQHPFVKLCVYRGGLWENCQITVCAVIWRNPDAKPTEKWDMYQRWEEIGKVVRDEELSRPQFNIWLNEIGGIQTYVSTRMKLKRKLTYKELSKLGSLNTHHPMTLVQEKSTRRLIDELINGGVYTIDPKAETAIRAAVSDYYRISSPIMPPTDFELVAYSDEEETLECCREDWGFIVGNRYSIQTDGYKFAQGFTRRKINYDEAGNGYSANHDCILSGVDRMTIIEDSNGTTHRFLAHPNKEHAFDHPEAALWDIFTKPKVQTISDKFPEVVKRNREALEMMEIMGDFKYYPGQIEYLVHVGVKDNALLAADTGAGKSLFAISMLAMKGPKRALIIAPQGMVKSDDNDEEVEVVEETSQWMAEIQRFAPFLKVHKLFSMDDYNNICKANGGELPPGVYITYYEAMFSNGARESCPQAWTDEKLKEIMDEEGYVFVDHPDDSEKGYVKTIGKEKNGIRCILYPSMSTMIGDQFDMVIADECQKVCHLSAAITQILIRMQPKHRFLVTATPIPNLASDIFPLMGWVCVDNWYKGKQRNAAWPYTRTEIKLFTDTFLSHERDLTAEANLRAKDDRWRGKVERISPTLSSPARLLRLLKPTMAYISKEQCNPDMVKHEVIDIRVPIGTEQGRLYAYFSNRKNIPQKNPLQAARVQIAYLRGICADPAGFPVNERGGPKCSSNFNAKTVTILNLVKNVLERGEQVVIVNARVGQSSTLQQYLMEAGIAVSRIDSLTGAGRQSYEANQFKMGHTKVMLMGIKSSVGWSFPACPNLIIGSLEYTYGAKHQAEGRVYRVNSQHDVKIWCVLHSNTIEESMFDCVSVKQDAATICLLGRRVPRDFKPVDLSEVLAEAVDRFHIGSSQSESDCLNRWPILRNEISALSKHRQPLELAPSITSDATAPSLLTSISCAA
jgi:superfamily II DNA or RNA helicase